MPATISPLRTPKSGRSAGSHQRPPGSAAHPSNQAAPHVRDLDAALSFDALVAIASGLAWAQEPVPDDTEGAREARSIRLIATALYDVWLITWPTGSSIEPHDHGGARSILHVVAGELIETYSDQPHGGPSRTRLLRGGDATWGEPPFVHGLRNDSGAEATTLHVYSPPLSDLTVFPALDRGQRGRTVAVTERSPQASSSDRTTDTAAPGPGAATGITPRRSG